MLNPLIFMMMKIKIVSIITVICLLFSTSANAGGFWKKVGKFLGNVAEAAVVVGVDKMYDTYAPEAKAQYQQTMNQLNEQSKKRAEEDAAAWNQYKDGQKAELQKQLRSTTDYESQQMIQQQIKDLEGVSTYQATNYNTSIASSISAAVGINQQNIDRGMKWNAASNKYEKQNIVKDYIFDAAGNISGSPELYNKFRQISEIQNTYLSDRSKAMTEEEKQAALSKRNQAYFNIGYDTYQEAKDRQSQHLAEKLQISQKLMESGWYNDPQLASEVAGSIIAIQKSNLSEQEKTALFNAYGFGDAQQVGLAVSEVLSDNNSAKNAEKERIRAAEEAKRQAEQQRQEAERKATIERQNAIQQIETAKINGYAFDETALSPSQKSELDGIADKLNRYSDIKVLIVGHTCNIGYKNINQKKGLKRAEAGKEYLIGKGIAAERILVDSKGKTEPIVPNTSRENRKQNRRIVFVIE